MPHNRNLVEYKPLDLHWQDHQIVCKLAPIQKVDIHKDRKAEKKEKKLDLRIINLFVTSKNEITNSSIHQFTNLKCCIKAREPFKTPF